MMTDKLVAVSQDHDSSDGMAAKQFLVTWILFNRQITAVKWNTGTPASQNLVHLCMLAYFFMCVNFCNALMF